MNPYADPAAYWESRLSKHFNLTGVGYAALGPEYNLLMYQARLRALEKAFAATGRTLAGSRVLEVGCGSGFYTEYCARNGVADYVGVDITSISVTTLRQRFPKFQFVQLDITREEIGAQGGFDCVLAADVLYHIIEDAGFERTIQSICQSVRIGGALIIADVFPADTVQASAHVRLRSLGVYERLLQEHGFQIAHIEPVFVLLQPPIKFPGASMRHRLYSASWKVVRVMCTWRPMEALIARAFSSIDERFLLRRFGMRAFAVKWLVAVDTRVA